VQRSGLLQRPAAAALRLRLLQHGARWSVVMNIYAQVGLIVRI